MEITFKQRLFYFLPVLFCFCMPFGSLVLSAMIVLWTAVSFLNLDLKAFKAGLKNKNLWLLYLFFIITCISAAFSSNKTEALFGIEVKLSFILFPYLFYCFNWPAQIIKKCLVAFVSGCFFASLYLIGRATLYYFNGHSEYFFYALFSNFIHPSAFAMYLLLALCILIMFYYNWFNTQKPVMYMSFLFGLVFCVTIFLCSSKLGIISLFICAPILIFYKWRYFFNVKKTIYLLVGLSLILILATKLFPVTFERLHSITSFSFDNIDKTSEESTTVRFLIWQQCLEIIQNNFLFGVSVGDANDALYNAYETNGLTGAFENKLNAHNQFFQTFIGLGVIGFVILISITLGKVIQGVIRRNFLMFIFSLIIVLNFLVESMLQRSDGTLFYVFFFCLINRENIKNELQ